MSTLTVSNVSDGTLSIPTTYVTNGSAKAWVNFDGTGTIAARDSLNVSSLTDNGTGDYTVNFSSAMANANFCALLAASGETAGSEGFAYGAWLQGTTTYAVGSLRFQVGYPANATLYDQDYINLAFQGDLA